MITREEAYYAAARSANAAWAGYGHGAGMWTYAFPASRQADALADFLDSHDDASAETLYRFAMQEQRNPKPWEKIGRQLKVALEVFRASYLALMVLVRQADAARAEHVRAAQRQRLPNRGLTARVFERVDGMHDRTFRIVRPRGKAAGAVDTAGLAEPAQEPARPAPTASSSQHSQSKKGRGNGRR